MIKNIKKIVPHLLAIMSLLLIVFCITWGYQTKAIETGASNADGDWNKDSVRPFLVYTRSDTFGGVVKKNEIHVFAFEGDTICLGTNIYNSSLNLAGTGYRAGADGKTDRDSNHEDKGSIDIVMEDLSGNKIPIDITGEVGSEGYIPNVETETLAKNMTSVEGASDDNGHVYKPYTYIVSETGVYTFEFRSFNGVGTTNDNSTDVNKTKGWKEPTASNNQGALIASWDITVFNENGEKETGRTYADYLSLQMGHSGTAAMKEKYYVITNDSYIYEMKFLGIQPYTFSFFANNRGITDAATGNIIYKSVKDLKNTNQYQKLGINYTNPSIDDTDLNKNFYIFFEKPNEDLQGYLYEKAMLPDPATNLKFIRDDDIIEGMGGYFSFDVKGASTATLRIDFNIPGHEYAPVEISDVVVPYQTSYFYWDGKDGNGVKIPEGNYTYDQLKYTVTTKAGEIHFPLIDVETVLDGITFTRINDIYNNKGDKVNDPSSIYEATKNVVYYDETAIYYGEKVTPYGASEADVTYGVNRQDSAKKTVATDVVIPKLKDVPNNKNIMGYRNISYKNNNEYILYGKYGVGRKLRIGDHSYKNNRIDYTASSESQKEVIEYLDSAKYPVGQSKASGSSYVTTTDNLVQGITGTAGNWNSTTDYGIANYWTFTPSDEVEPDNKDNIKINSDNDNHFNLISRVFYDTSKSSGIYNQQSEGDHLLSDVTLKLYKKTEDNTPKSDKSYVKATTSNGKITLSNITSFASSTDIYELVKTAITPLQGTYLFTALEYDKENGTEYIYQVVRPNSSYQVTSESKTAANNVKTEKISFVSCANDVTNPCTSKTTTITYEYGPYMAYAYDKNGKGTEVQKFVVGGSNGIKLDTQDNKTISTIDVGYYYDKNSKSLEIKKSWGENSTDNPEIVVFEVSYNSNNSKTQVYEERALTASLSWSHSYDYLPSKLDNLAVTDYFVSAEYYIYNDKIIKHQYEYDTINHIYKSFVGKDYYFSLTEYYKSIGEDAPSTFSINNLPDFNKDGRNDLNDLKSIPVASNSNQVGWKEAASAGTIPKSDDVVVAPYSSVLDRNPGSAVNEINIVNASLPGTIEILKYTGDITENQVLSGATFRIYKGTEEEVRAVVEKYNAAQAALQAATSGLDIAKLKADFEQASRELNDIQVDSGSTRVNGRIAFANLDPRLTYTIRERFAPSGYRIIQEYYQVNPKASSNKVKFDENNYYLLEVGNATASGELEIRKMIQGRTWLKNDTFDYDITFNYNNNDKSGITIDLTEQNLFNKTFETEVQEFVNNFNNEVDFTINYQSDYAKNGTILSADTKVYNNLLYSGDESSYPGLMKHNFPAAGTYTFQIKELPIDADSNLTAMGRVFKIEVKVTRVLNDEESTDPINTENSHLEAKISSITYNEATSQDNIIYAGSTPTFVSTYDVEQVKQAVSYKIASILNGRTNNEWLDDDAFTYIIDGKDSVTQQALIDRNLIIGGTFNKVDGSDTAMTLTINKTTKNHEFVFDFIEFDNVLFDVKRDESDPTGTPKTQPIVYFLTIKQINPKDAVNNVYKGITYATDEYQLKITLINSVNNETGETDGIIDEIIFDLYKNYDENNPSLNTPVATCKIFQEIDAAGTVHVTQQHAESAKHTMTFTNTYTTKSVSWEPIVYKSIIGRDWVLNDSFIFTISNQESNGLVMPADRTVTISKESTRIDDNTYEEKFGAVTFTKVGTYNFEVKENFVDANGLKLVTTPSKIAVNIEDNQQGELTITFNNGNMSSPILKFVNTYNESGDLNVTLSKTLEGRSWAEDDEFTFIITPNANTLKAINSDQIKMPTTLGSLIDNHYEVSIKKDESSTKTVLKDLEKITFTTSGSYSFTISEKQDDLKNIELSDQEIVLDLNVSQILDNGIPNGNLNVIATFAYTADEGNKKTIRDEGTSANVVIPFTNFAYIDADFEVIKNLEGRDWNRDETFKVIVDLNDKVNVKSLDGLDYEHLSFTELEDTHKLNFRFYKVGTYMFTIREEIPDSIPSGLTYDKSIYTIRFDVTEDNGVLSINKSIKKDNVSDTNIIFNNIYSTGSLNISNTIIGSTEDEQLEFNFKVTLSDRSISDKFGDIEFADGEAIFSLKNNEHKIAQNLPAGIYYSVEQTDSNTDNFVTTYEGESGSIIANETHNAAFTNTKYYDLAVTGGSLDFWIATKAVMLFEILAGLYLLKKFMERKKIK